ncbi:hypothetical protein SELR_pSRC102260 (plasmid) [Selenomonas ruminantium subsp. lactilytica TAM6421]|uniref:KAP NTPase domain-containing protein n=1 Tax=Selenomonas ruminantium subsp. lactilytica (strain NBRC 103574 / TAM6421) TaxID=927704 RepID=I0GW96_SELRL|nr:P-loop NTPase fold protein [Selenomonas ruminantium]BAL85033.1 hypothetical protein SELR_pSRC102260 [Selenomonas ruminantium subsp. lactilytica TAM6421]
MKVPSYMLSSYVGRRVITPAQRDVLFHAFSQRLNIIVCGNHGVGKTTFLNAIANELHHLGARTVLVQNFNEFSFHESAKIHPIFTFNSPITEFNQALAAKNGIVINELEAGIAKPLLLALRRGRKGVHLGLSDCSDAGHALMRYALLSKTSFQEVPHLIDLVVHMEINTRNQRSVQIKAVDGFNEKTSEFILRDFDTLNKSIQAAS